MASNSRHLPSGARRTLVRITLVLAVLAGSGAVAVAATVDRSVAVTSTQAPTLHARDIDGSGVTVAIIDTGVEPLPALDGAVIAQANFSDGPATGDQHGHGTFVAGLVHEVAPDARILSIKLSGADGAVDVTQVIAALQWLAVHGQEWGVDVVNLSFGNDSTQPTTESPLNFAVQRVWDAGMVVVASAGNVEGAEGRITKPGDDPLVVTVGASDDQRTVATDDDAVASWSASGPTLAGLAKPDIVAPGTKVTSLRVPGSTIDVQYPQARIGSTSFRGSGTSFSAPIVSGVAALLLELRPGTSPDVVKSVLMNTARPIRGPADAEGRGTVQAAYAAWLLASGNATRTNRSVVRSTGRGSIRWARGNRRVNIRIEATADQPGTTLTAEAALQVDTFEPLAFDVEGAWDASRWGASRWGASRWGSVTWDASTFGETQFWASRWG